jgi:hypothetical protein
MVIFLCSKCNNRSHIWLYVLITYLSVSGDLISQICCGGTDVQFLASRTIAPASIKPYPKEWLTERTKLIYHKLLRRVWRYQRGNQNLYIKEEQTTQQPKEKVQKDKQWSTKHTHKTKDRVSWTSLKTDGELGCSGRVRNSCSTSGTCRVNLATNPVINHYRFRLTNTLYKTWYTQIATPIKGHLSLQDMVHPDSNSHQRSPLFTRHGTPR